MELLQSSIDDSIVQVFSSNGLSIGTGFLFHEDGLILTASHVVSPVEDQRAGVAPPEEVSIEFIGHLKLTKKRTAFVTSVNLDYWVPFDDGDICVLQLSDAIPSGVKVLPIGSSDYINFQQNRICYYGFPDRQTGSYGEGKVMGEIIDESLKFNVLQFHSEQIAEGYSGSPALEMNSGLVIGMLSFMRDKDRGYLVPSSELRKTIPSLVFKRAFEPQQNIQPKGLILENALSAHGASQIQILFPEQKNLAIQQLIKATAKLLSRRTAIKTLEDLDYFLLANKLDYVVGQIDTNRALPVVWEMVIDILKYNKTLLIVEFIEQLFSRDNNIDHYEKHVSPIVNRWKKISKNPNRYIFEKYLWDIVNNNKYIHLDKIYVELVGEREISPDKTEEDEDLILDPTAVEQKHLMSPEDYWQNIEQKTPTNDKIQNEKPNNASPKIDSILNIAKTEERFALIGAPGSGKTFTLQKILFRNAKSILQSPVSGQFKLPILVISNQYNGISSFEDLILTAFPDWNNPELNRSNFLILLDGLNEINPSHQEQARQELNLLLLKYPDTSFILSSRKYGFSNTYHLTVFELKDLNPNQVKKYIASYYPSETERIWEAIHDRQNSKNLSLAYNPLTLFMIIFTYDPDKDTVLPLSRGSLYREFLHTILKRDSMRKGKINTVSTETKEELLSELAFEMRIKDFNPSILSVKNQLRTKLNNDYQLANQLLDQLCDTYILKITEYQKKQNLENTAIKTKDKLPASSQKLTDETPLMPILTVAEAKEEETVSFMHESYLEFFCSLELKRTFLAQGKLPINFAATEWFETLLMASDLFSIPENLQRYISYIYTGGWNREIPLKLKIEKHKRRVKKKKYALTIDLHKLKKGYWFERMDIACKLAYNIKDKFPKIYQHFERILLDDLLLWRQAFLRHLGSSTGKIEQFPDLSILFKAVGGLSSKKVFQTIFEDDIWQMIWLISVDDNNMRSIFDDKNKVRPNYSLEEDLIEAPIENHREKVKGQRLVNRINDWNKLNLHHRFTQLIDNLSDFELFYDYLVGEKETEKLTITLTNHQLDTLRSVLYNNMPLKLQKKLYERTKRWTLLERIGRQDLEYYMHEFDRNKYDTYKFVQYLFSFAYNPKVQQKLLELLSAEEVDLETQAAIFKILLKKFYCVRQVLGYLEKNADKMLYNKLITKAKIRNYLSRIPSELIPPVLKLKYFSQEKRASIYEYFKKTKSSYRHEILINDNDDLIIGKISFTKSFYVYPGFTALLDQPIIPSTISEVLLTHNLLEIQGVGEVEYQGVTTSGKGSLTYYWVSLTAFDTDSPYLKPGGLEGGNMTIDKNYTTTIKKSKVVAEKKSPAPNEKMLKITIQTETKRNRLADKYLILPELQEKLAIKHGTYLGNKLYIELEDELDGASKSKIMQISHLQTEKTTPPLTVLKWDFEQSKKKMPRTINLVNAITELKLQADDWYVVDTNHLHKDEIYSDNRIQSLLYAGLQAELPIFNLIKRFGINHLYHKSFPYKTDYGIVLRTISDHNSVFYYSNTDEEVHQIYLEKRHLRSLSENDIVVIEENQVLYPINDYERTQNYGFIKSFVNGVQFTDDQNRYFFILNDKSKDFFTHSSRVDFYPEQYDVISFFPCKNPSNLYTNFPLARKLKRLKPGTQEEYSQALDCINWITKYENSLQLEPQKTTIRQELVGLHLAAENYYQALNIINGYPEEKLPLMFILQKGNAYFGLKKYRRAMQEYQFVFSLPYATRRSSEYKTFNLHPSVNLKYIERIAHSLSELGQLSEGIRYIEEYFRNHDYSEDNIHLVNKQIMMQVASQKNAKSQAVIRSIPEEFHPMIGQSFFLVAKTHARKSKNMEQAIVLFEQALKYEPSAKTYVRYALFTYQIGDFARADSLLKQALEQTDNKLRLLAYYHRKLGKIEKIIILESLTIYEKFEDKLKYIAKLTKEGHYVSAVKVTRALHSLYRQKKIGTNPLSSLKHYYHLRSGKALWSSRVYESLVEKAFQYKRAKEFPFIIIEYAYTLLFEKNTVAAYGIVNDAFDYLETFSINETERQAISCELYALAGKITKKEAFKLLEEAPDQYLQKLEEASSFFMLAKKHAISKEQTLDQYINVLTIGLATAEKINDLNSFNTLYRKVKEQFPNSNRLLKMRHSLLRLEKKIMENPDHPDPSYLTI